MCVKGGVTEFSTYSRMAPMPDCSFLFMAHYFDVNPNLYHNSGQIYYGYKRSR